MREFLAESCFCDVNHPEIKKIAREITREEKTDTEKAIKLFYWVRDNIPYTFGKWNIKASEVLSRKRGMCTNKTLLLCTLLRSVGIPSAFGLLRVKGQEYFGPISISILTRNIKKVSVHWYCYVYCNGRWFKIDPSPDKALSEKTSYFNHTTEMVEWDGTSDAMENINQKHIISDVGPLPSIDNRLRKSPRKRTVVMMRMGNLYLEFIRKHLGEVEDIKELEPKFLSWLKRSHPFYYYCLRFSTIF